MPAAPSNPLNATTTSRRSDRRTDVNNQTTTVTNPLLNGRNTLDERIDEVWEQSNQEWWDWYVTLAEAIPDDVTGPVSLSQLPYVPRPSSAALERELTEPYQLTATAREQFRREGYVKLKNVLSAPSLLHLRTELVRLLAAASGAPLDGGVRNRFLSLDMVWLENELVRRFVLSPRIGKLAADLLDVPSVRLYHDNVLSKEPGCGRTPWHHDDAHFPLATDDVVTVWIPVQPIPESMGPLAFVRSMDADRLVENIPFNKVDTSYDARVAAAFGEANLAIDTGPFNLGEVSFHHNRSFHTAGPNHTERSRVVLSNTYYVDGARLVEEPTMISGDWQKFAPGVRPGDQLTTPVNPVCWPPAETPLDWSGTQQHA